MVKFGFFGIWEVLIIALCVMWLLNAYRKNQILKKIDDRLDQNPSSKTSPHKSISKFPDAEDVDYEEVK